MARPDIGLAASARAWSDRLHRFVLDHGGATVSGRMMSASQALAGSFEVLLIDDICSFLNPRLIGDLRKGGKAIIGVFDPDDGSDAKRRLVEVGISDVIESDASPEEFLELCTTVLVDVRPPDRSTKGRESRGSRMLVCGPPGGVGVTEIACGIAFGLAANRSVALLDANQRWPGVAQRLGLPAHPNVMTALDHVLHEPERLPEAWHRLDGLDVVCGLANPRVSTLSGADVASVVDALADSHSFVVTDLGPVGEMAQGVNPTARGLTILVGLGTPAGVTRLVRAFEMASGRLGDRNDVCLVINRAGNSARHREEIRRVVARSIGEVPVMMVPDDPRLRRWSWDGVPPGRGPFHRAMARLASTLIGVVDDG